MHVTFRLDNYCFASSFAAGLELEVAAKGHKQHWHELY